MAADYGGVVAALARVERAVLLGLLAVGGEGVGEGVGGGRGVGLGRVVDFCGWVLDGEGGKVGW